MCLAIPMRIEEINGFMARCEARGVTREVSLFMLPEGAVAVGDYVMVHVGYAIQTMTAAEARSSWELFDEMFAREAEQAAVRPSDDEA